MKRIGVYCGSRSGNQPDYTKAAEHLAQVLVQRRLEVVYGGASVGTMGVLANAALAAGGQVIGVIPRSILDREIVHRGLTDLRVVASMHERKALMAELSDGFIALPGGLGTLDEVIEILSWGQLGLHRKPCGLLNVRGYYRGLIDFLDHAVAERFITDVHRAMILVAEEPEELLERFEHYQAPPAVKGVQRPSA